MVDTRVAVIFTPTARRELVDARNWYDRKSAGLGVRFLDAVDSVVQRIAANPAQFPIVYKSIHRALLQRFPYALMFVTETEGGATVLACFHGSRDPARWQRRM